MYTNNDQYDKMPRHELIEELKSWHCKYKNRVYETTKKQKQECKDIIKSVLSDSDGDGCCSEMLLIRETQSIAADLVANNPEQDDILMRVRDIMYNMAALRDILSKQHNTSGKQPDTPNKQQINWDGLGKYYRGCMEFGGQGKTNKHNNDIKKTD